MSKYVKIELNLSVIHQNKAELMQKFTTWWKKLIFCGKTWYSKGGCFSTPPWYLSIKIDVGIKRVNGAKTFNFYQFSSRFLSNLHYVYWIGLVNIARLHFQYGQDFFFLAKKDIGFVNYNQKLLSILTSSTFGNL